jgi:hypothetical protein
LNDAVVAGDQSSCFRPDEAPMTMTLPASTPAPARPVPHEMILRVAVALVGLIEAFAGLVDLVVIGDIAGTPDLSPGGLAALAPMVLRLLLGVAAVGFAVTRQLRLAVAALAVWALARWGHDISLLMRDERSVSLAYDVTSNSLAVFRAFGQPLLSAAALAAAWRNRHLAAATAAIAVMTLVDLGGIAVFAIGVALYGA